MKKEDIKANLSEFIRYALVGGLSAVVDMGVNYVTLYYIFVSDKNDKPAVTLSVAAGFMVGLLVNFFLSNIFVFRSAEQKQRGQTVGSFMIYAVVGVVGLILSVLLTLAGTSFIGETGIWYIFLNCAVKGVVLIWNYLGRKIFVYKGM